MITAGDERSRSPSVPATRSHAVPAVVGCDRRRREMALDSQPVPALFPLAALEERVVGGDWDDSEEFHPESLARAARGVVLGVAGDPERPLAVAAEDRDQEAAGALGVVSAAGGRVDVVAD